MARRNSMMSENLKEEIAKELGVYEQVKKETFMQTYDNINENYDKEVTSDYDIFKDKDLLDRFRNTIIQY